jgi:eukaryotic-like serine/threonine-protein kinase
MIGRLSLAVGSRLGVFDIIAPVGAGGMGEVYRASDTKLDRVVALKLLPEAFAGDPARLARFEREAKLLASLNHPGIAHLYGFEAVTLGNGSQAHVLVMELVEGEDLAARVKRGPLAIDEALQIAKQIAEALEEAHEKGIVHRDLKPANVKVTPDGKVKVLDFGLAKAWTGDSSSGSSADLSQSPTLAHTGTAAGLILGTAAYMAPEQARGKTVDKRADIWAFGVVLYEMLTGRALFGGETVSDVLAGVLARDIDWTPLPGRTPPSVRRLLGRCLERDPRQRLRDIGEARHELERPLAILLTDPAAGSAGSRRSRRAAILAPAVAGLLGAALVLAAVSWRSAQPGPPMVFSLPAPPGTRLNQVVISPDGRSLAYAAESPSGETNLWLRSLDSRHARMMEGTSGALEPFWSPDSRFVGFFTEAQLLKLEAATGAVEAIAPTSDTRGAAWRADGTILFGGNKLNRVQANGGPVSPVLEADAEAGENAIRYPALLPGGSQVLFYSRNARDRARAGLWVVSLETGARKQLATSAASSAVYVEPGYLLYRRDRYLVAHRFDARRLEFTGEPRTIAEDIWYDPGVTAQSNVSVSTSGIVTYRTGGVDVSELAWLDRQGRLLGTEWEPKGFTSLALSRDGRQILVSFPDQGVERHVWLYDIGTATTRQITTSGDAITLAFSEDSTRGLLGMHSGPTTGLWVARLTSGTAPVLLPTNRSRSALFAMDWRGSQVIYAALAPGTNRVERALYMLDTSTGEDRALVEAPGNELFGVVSPDGRRLAYSSDETGQWEVYVATFPKAGERWRVSTRGGHQPRWNPDGSELFYIAPDRQLMSVRLRAGADGFQWDAPRALFQTAIVDLGAFRSCWGYAVAPDGKRFLILTRRPQGTSPAVAILNWKPGA